MCILDSATNQSTPSTRLSIPVNEKSNFIRYPLNEELLTEAPNVNESAVQLIKFHGSYQPYNREERGGGRSYSFMLHLSASRRPEARSQDRDEIHYQKHGEHTLCACGDLNKNVLAPAAPYARRDYLFGQETADHVAALLSPQSGFYCDRVHSAIPKFKFFDSLLDYPTSPQTIISKKGLSRAAKEGFTSHIICSEAEHGRRSSPVICEQVLILFHPQAPDCLNTKLRAQTQFSSSLHQKPKKKNKAESQLPK
ncbi:Uncharacterized protein Rs2_25613 [Raphanus sativus]|nr:Uncharacterized protein Rs2_25613 [Raphanus sativus]